MAASSPATCRTRSARNDEVKRAYLGDQHAVTAPWLINAAARSRRHRDLLRPEPGAVRPVAVDQAGRDGRADGPQRHGQDHHHPLHHGADAGARRHHPLRRAARCASLPSYKIAKLGIGLVPEGRQIFPNLTVRENLVAASGNRLGSPDPWTWKRSTRCFRGSPSAAATWASRCPAASSRCSRSAAR